MMMSRVLFPCRLPVLAASLSLIAAAAAPAHADRDLVAHGKSWSIQLQGNSSSIAKRNTDVAVVDPDEVKNPAKLKSKANGGKRAVLAYISVGEAEDYRGYMKKGSKRWLSDKGQGWSGNKMVKYWDPEWQAIVKSRVRAAIDAGYDGVYLDRIDTYERMKAPKGKSSEAMKQLVKDIAGEARRKKSNAAVAVQNAEELLGDKSYVGAIDAIGKEDLYHGIKHDGSRNDKGAVSYSREMLKKAKAQGKGVYVVEYVGGKTASSVKAQARKDGFVPTVGHRDLKSATDE
jgi:cysteinyl-tRNA synthetase